MIALMGLFLFASCENFMDIHKEYLEGGETVYSSKPLEIIFNGGIDKIEFICLMENATNVKTIDIFYTNTNNRPDSLIIPVSLNIGYDTVRTVMPNMGEKNYNFTVRTTDINGNKSLNVTGSGASYGPDFLSTLTSRVGNPGAYTATSGTINWSVIPASVAWSELAYIDRRTNEEITIKIMPNQSSTALPYVYSIYKYRSVFMPEPASIDTIYGAWTEASFLPKYTLWMAGDATVAAWDANKQVEMPFDESNPWVYVYEGALTPNEIKILFTKGDWNGNTIRPMVASGSIQSTEYQIYAGGTDLKWKVLPDEIGNYKIIVNMNEQKIYFELQGKLPKTDWTADADSWLAGWGDGQGQSGSGNGGYPVRTIDGDLSSAWHSTTASPDNALPHWIRVDLGSEQDISHVKLFLHNTYRYARTVRIYTSLTNDVPADKSDVPAAWNLSTTYTFASPQPASATIKLPTVQRAKYLIIYFTDSTSGSYSNFAEIEAYSPS
jgi:hypothetical protein